MRFSTARFSSAKGSSVVFALAALLVAGTASAAGGVGGKGDTGGKGGKGPQIETNASADDAPTTDTSVVQQKNPDKRQQVEEEKPWELGGTWEMHRMIRQEDTGNSDSKVFNVLFFAGHYDLTERDRISAGWALTQKYIADPGESGWRGSDVSLAYTHTQPLPRKFMLRGSVSATIPTSYSSQLQGLYTAPGASIGVSRKFGDLALDARISGGAFITKYREAGSAYAPSSGGGVPNPKYRANAAISAEYAMPFHRALQIGASLFDAYIWFYDVNGQPPSSSWQGAVQDPQFQSQPMLQSYGGEIYARYILPTLYGFKSDATISLASGAGALGSNAVLHEGVVHPYIFYRNTAEVYGTFSVRY